MIAIVIILIHIIGMFVYSFLNKDRIGKTEFHSILNGYVVDTIDIVMESFFWEFMLLALIIVSPIMLIAFMIDFIRRK